MNKEIKLGETVRCIHTGFKGVAVARTEYINGCIQYSVLPKCDKDGKMPEELSLDIQSLEVIPSKKKKKSKRKSYGGPMNKGLKQRGF